MKRMIWRENKVISIETRRQDENRETNVYVLAQMVSKAELVIFDLFNTDNNWSHIDDLSKVPILFCTSVTRQFIKNSNTYKQNIKGIVDYEPPKFKIDSLGMGRRDVTVWAGTPNERIFSILGHGGGRLIEEYMSSEDYVRKTIIPEIDETDLETINKYELTNVRIYAEFNERLYLCYKMKKNVDPLKDLTFNLPIPLEYKEYIYIISS